MFIGKLAFARTVVCIVFMATLASCVSLPSKSNSGSPWNLPALSRTPSATWGIKSNLIQEVYYEGEPLNGQPTRVFAYLGQPPESSGRRLPAMVLVHGGGGRAFRAWAEHWAQRGYVAIAMDLGGNGPNGPLPDGGPAQADAVKFRNFSDADAKDMWTYHAVAAVIRAHSLLRSQPDVDPNRIGITGISWGGYLTCIVAGIDRRLKVAIPVYGCGFLGDNSVWTDKSLADMNPDSRERWLRLFDPSQYLAGVRCPILFLNGTTDFAYPLDSYRKSYQRVDNRFRHISVVINLPHGHIWTFPEVDAFADAALGRGDSFRRTTDLHRSGDQLEAQVDLSGAITNAALCYTWDLGPWQKRTWQTTPAQISGRSISATLPQERPLVAFLALTDRHGLRLSTEHIELPAPP